jgi:nuclease S1
MNRLLIPVLTGLLAATITSPAAAWGRQGHALVAEVAQTRLTPQTEEQVDALLALEGHPDMAAIASWADELRERDPQLGRRSAGWHYVNLASPEQAAEAKCHYQQEQHCHDGNCVIAAIQEQGQRLADTSLAPEQRLQALKFVVHFVGDIHQPMHAGYSHDKGGNDMQIQHDGRGSNLHALWDSGMLATRGLDNPAYLARLQALPAPALLPGQAAVWAENSCQIAVRDGVYPSKRRIDQTYVDHHLPVAEEQLRLAGEHLADLLNTLLGDPAQP